MAEALPKQHITFIFFLISLCCCLPYKLLSRPHISYDLYTSLTTQAHLIDIAYCISPLTRIRYPFECDNGCEEFPNTEVVYQWTSDEVNLFYPDDYATSGYIALRHDTNEILLILRGTRSFKDTIVDLNADMIPFNYPQCINCKVHKGFHRSFLTTWRRISDPLALQISKNPSYELLVMGHSLGGAVSVLLALKSLHVFVNTKVKCITMGSPMIGNSFFANFIDETFQINDSDPFQNGNLLRITHENDPVVKLPWSESYLSFDHYSHSSNEIFINETGSHLPLLTNVVYCDGNNDPDCASGMSFTRDNTEHLNYFRRMGKCGFGI